MATQALLPPWTPRLSRAAVAAFCLAAAAAFAEPAPPFGEQVVVREIEVSVQLPDDISIFKLRSLQPSDFVVLRDGRTETVTRIEPAWHGRQSEPWKIVVYADGVLASRPTATAALAALTRRVDRLAKLGEVDLVLADPVPHRLRPADREAKDLRVALGEMSARLGRDPKAPPPDAAAVRRQVERLLAWLAGEPTVGPRLLWLIADRVPLSLDALNLLGEKPAAGLDKGLPPASPTDRATAVLLRDAGRDLAAYGWVALAGPLGQPEGEPLGPQMSDYDRFRHDVWNQPSVAVPILRWPWKRSTPDRLSPSALVAALDPSLAPLRQLVLTTSGWLVPAESDVDPALDILFQRFRLWFRASDALDGQVHSLVVRLRQGGVVLRAPRWVRSATPESLADARLRRALAGEIPTGGDLKLQATLGEGAGGQRELRLEASAAPPAGGPSAWRLSWAVETDSGIVVEHRTLAGGDGKPPVAGGFRQPLSVAGPLRRVAVLLERLADEAWGVQVLTVRGGP